MVLAFFMVMTLAACSGSKEEPAAASGTETAAAEKKEETKDPNADKYGTYTIVKLSVDGEELEQEVFNTILEAMKQQGSMFDIVVGKKSYFEFRGSGNKIDIDIDFDKGTISEAGGNDNVPFKYENGNIIIESEGVVMTFGR